ncbi:hypothetical protein BUL40_10340 [Croceivirga radicis]|uniref:AAA+ ATPase domain-containing protein n=1 Tax=Croceivirga radicis TaxID=1929488 RepID=A0A1V6LQP0_9FLAO|nr:DnaA/Hda family protein [Croceivirga radicis]OQD42511.1 hypothetical protein BUL40_10340 [Croceivirga radicis]
MNTTIYNPANKRKEQLINEFVVRTKEFNQIFTEITENLGQTINQHYLIIGQRGSGKTTLIHRVKYAIEEGNEFKNVIPITLGEEQYGISELLNLWEKIAEVLEDYYHFNNLCIEVQDKIDAEENQSEIFEQIFNRVRDKNKIIILFIDNFIDLLDKFSKKEINYLQSVLVQCLNIKIVAASPISPENLDESFENLFHQFHRIHLNGLTNSEIRRLLLKLSESDNSKNKIEDIIQNNPERIEILRLLTGGVTRTIVSLYKIFTDNVSGKSVRDLQLTLDSVTPLYKHNMDDLPKNQQKIVDVIAKSWDATSVKEIVKSTRKESKTVSAQIRQLEKKQIIEKIPTDTKNHLYQIKERFFNIWYLMRYGRKHDRKRVIWLVRFLESWCSKEELESRITSHISYLESGQYDEEAASLLGEAYLACKSVGLHLKKELLNSSIKYLPENLTEGMNYFDSDVFKTAFEYYKEEEYETAIKYALEITDEKVYGFLTDNYLRIGDLDNALKYSDLSIKTANPDKIDFALRGEVFHELKQYEDAIDSFKMALEKGNEYVQVELGVVYFKNEQFEKAEEAFLKGIEIDSCKVQAYHQLGHLYEFLNEKEKAISNFEKAIELGNDKAQLCLARFYDMNDDFINSESHYLKALEKYPVEAKISLALLNFDHKNESKGLEYLNDFENTEDPNMEYLIGRIYDRYTENSEKAIKHLQQAIDLGNNSAYHKLAHVYQKIDDKKNAEKSFIAAYEIGEDYSALLCLAEFYREYNINKEKALEHIQNARENLEFDHSEITLLAITLLWNNQLEKSLAEIEPVIDEFSQSVKNSDAEVLYDDLVDTEEIDDEEDSQWDFLIEYFIELISYDNYESALKLLTEYDLIETFKPIYFSLMYFMKEKYPSEYLKMGDEVKEIVEDIIEEIKDKKKNRIE